MSLNALGLGIVLSMRDMASVPAQRAAGALGQLDDTAQKFSRSFTSSLATAMEGMNMMAAGVLAIGAPAAFLRSTFETQEALSNVAVLGMQEIDKLAKASMDYTNRWAGATRKQFLDAAYFIKSGIETLSEEAVGEYTRMLGITAKATRTSVDQMQELYPIIYGILRQTATDMNDIDFGGAMSAGLAQAVKIFRTTGKYMGDAFSQLTTMATQIGVDAGEQMAVLGMLQQTMTGSEAGTKFRALLRGSAKASHFAEQFGINITNAEGNLLPIVDLMEVLKGHFGDTIKMADRFKLQTMFGSTEAVAVIDQLYNNTDLLRQNTELINKAMAEGMDFVEAMALVVQGNISDIWTTMMQQVKNLKEVFGEALIPMFGPIIKFFGNLVIKMQEIAKNSGGIIRLGSALAMLIGTMLLAAGAIYVLAGATMMISGAIDLARSRIVLLRTESLRLIATMWPFMVVALLAFLAYKTNFMGIRDQITMTIDTIENFFNKVGKVKSALQELFSSLVGVKGTISAETRDMLEEAGLWEITKNLFMLGIRIQALWQGMSKGFTDFWTVMVSIIRPIGYVITKFILSPLQELLSWLGINIPIIDKLLTPTEDAYNGWIKVGYAIGLVAAAFSTIGVGLAISKKVIIVAKAIAKAFMWVVGIGKIVVSAIGTIIAVVAAFVGVSYLVAAAIVAAVILIFVGIVYYWDEIVYYIKQAWNAIVYSAEVAWEAIVNAWNAAADWFSTYVIDPIIVAWENLWNFIKNSPSKAWAFIQTSLIENEWFSGIITDFHNAWENLWNFIKNSPSEAWEFIKNSWNGAVDWFGSIVIDPLTNAFGSLFDWLEEKFAWAFKSVDFVSNIGNSIKDTAGNAWDAAKDFGSNLWPWGKKEENTVVPSLASGGFIQKDGFANLHAGEAVLNNSITDKIAALADIILPWISGQNNLVEAFANTGTSEIINNQSNVSKPITNRTTINNIYNYPQSNLEHSSNEQSQTKAQPTNNQMAHQQPIVIEIPISLDGRVITKAVANHIDSERRRS